MKELNWKNLVSNNNKLSPTLQCSICLDFIMEPIECQNCNKLFWKNVLIID